MNVPQKEVIIADQAPRALGPYSVGIRAGHLIFASGQLGIDPASGEIVEGGIEAETRQVLINLKHVLEASGSGLHLIVKTTVFLRDMGDFARMNAVYGEFFTDKFPARSTVQVAALPKAGAVEIEAVALVGSHSGD
jgi:2-iminobutanoate/2-iminopropanoate deaminase